MRRQIITALCVLSLANGAVAANPTRRLHPGDADALRAARMDISCKILNAQDLPDNPHYAFWITAGVPEGFDSLDASFAVRNDKGLVTHSSWRSSEGKCVVAFMVGEVVLKDAWFEVQLHKGNPLESGGWSASGRYVLKLSELTGERGAAPTDEDFGISNPIKSVGPMLTIGVKRKDAFANHWYDLHVSVAGRSDQQFEVRRAASRSRSTIFGSPTSMGTVSWT